MFMFSSPVPHRLATFVRISTAAGKNVTVTPNHYLFSLLASDVTATASTSLHAWRYTLPAEVRPLLHPRGGGHPRGGVHHAPPTHTPC